MSLILGFASKDNAIIMGDGRAVGDYASENVNKTMKVNDNIIIGFAGIKEKVETFIDHLFKEMGSNRKDYFIDDFLEMIDFYMKDKETQNQLQSSFIMIGKTKNRQMITSIAGHVTDYEVQKNVVEMPRILTIGGTVDKELINKIFFENMKKSSVPLIKRMNNTIVEISRLDESINSNIFYVSL